MVDTSVHAAQARHRHVNTYTRRVLTVGSTAISQPTRLTRMWPAHRDVTGKQITDGTAAQKADQTTPKKIVAACVSASHMRGSRRSN